MRLLRMVLFPLINNIPANFSSYSISEVIKGSTLVTQQISIVVLFVILFIFTLNHTLALSSLVGMEVITMIVGFGVRVFCDPSFDG